MSTYTLRTAEADKIGADALVVGILKGDKAPKVAPGGEAVATAFGRRLAPLLASLGVTGKAGEAITIPTSGTIKAPLLILVGLGPEVTPESIRRAAGVAARVVTNASSLAFALPSSGPEDTRATIEGHFLGGYRFAEFKSEAAPLAPNDVVILTPRAKDDAELDAVKTALVVSRARARVRDWVNHPPGHLTPPVFADAMAEYVGDVPELRFEVLDDAALTEQGFGGIIGVGRGSANPPRLVRVDYAPEGATKHLVLVGKGITFDSGGLSIKPAASMVTMKMDMAGAAAVVAAIKAIAELGIKVQVTAFAPLAENMISGNATRPGDVLTMKSGATVEVANTDAEGRLILADALDLAQALEPDLIVDVATLTGACMVALGDRVVGVMGNDEDAQTELLAAAESAGEAMWPLPIPAEMGEKVRGNSKVADLAQHNPDRWGGALYAAAFLREFVGKTPWLHLDIAGPAFNEKPSYGYVTSGGTGVAVATLTALAQRLSEV